MMKVHNDAMMKMCKNQRIETRIQPEYIQNTCSENCLEQIFQDFTKQYFSQRNINKKTTTCNTSTNQSPSSGRVGAIFVIFFCADRVDFKLFMFRLVSG